MAERVHIHIEFETRLAPDRVGASLVDFTDARLDYWPNIDPARYEVHETGAGYAIVTEGSADPPVWARERYDWSADLVTITALESNFCTPGDGTRIAIGPGSDGGSAIVLDWEREARSSEWQPLMDLMRERGAEFLLTAYQGNWDRHADTD